MLHVDVYIPAIMRSYEFSLNEHAKIGALIEEIAAIVRQKENRQWEGEMSGLLLCNESTGHILPTSKTLYQCKVKPGSRLILL